MYYYAYRTDEFKATSRSVERQRKNLDAVKAITVVAKQKKKHDKKVKGMEADLKSAKRELDALKQYPNMFGVVANIASTVYISNFWSGRVSARLPFVPFGVVSMTSHRGVEGEDMQDCAFLFLFILCNMSIRVLIQKALGTAPARGDIKIPWPDEEEMKKWE